MMRSGVVAAALAVTLLAGAPAGWADYAAGRQAWEERRYADALGEWRSAAQAGDARAMLALGRLYREGLGALQDFVEAHKWFNLAASRGEAAAAKERNELAARMTPQQVAEAQARAASWRPGAFRDCEECPEMVVVPAGGFLMGSPDSERGRYGNEGPVHPVEVARSFAIGAYEVTFAQWDACVAGGGCRGYRPPDEGWGRGSRPVVNVSWEDAQSYVRWLSGKTGVEYRLLSESEWEYAARAGSGTRYHWGDGIGRNRANCDGCGSRWDLAQTAPVGSFGANGFGLHDVHGNVWEWVEDCWNEGYRGAPSDGSAWESGDCGRRVLRGGSWFGTPRNLRSALRSRYDIGNRIGNVGFRVARTLAP